MGMRESQGRGMGYLDCGGRSWSPIMVVRPVVADLPPAALSPHVLCFSSAMQGHREGDESNGSIYRSWFGPVQPGTGYKRTVFHSVFQGKKKLVNL